MLDSFIYMNMRFPRRVPRFCDAASSAGKDHCRGTLKFGVRCCYFAPSWHHRYEMPRITGALGLPGADASTSAAFKSGHIEWMTPKRVGVALGADGLVVGLQFIATHQLRVPLRVLSRHGEVHRDMHSPAPIIAMAPFEGIWLPLTKTYRELGIDMDELPWTVASDIGPVLSHDYLPFLVAMRSIVESEGTATARRGRLIDELRRSIWDDARNRSGGAYAVADRFFPPFIASIQGLPCEAASVLRAKGLKTAASLTRASDAELLAIKGIGPAKLKLLRAACVAATEQDEEWRDLVLR